MKKPGVVVVDGNRQNGKQFCKLLKSLEYVATLATSLEDLESFVQERRDVAVILDLDTVPADKQYFRALKKKYPLLPILGVSSLAYHPGLEEVIGGHFYACLLKPLDMDEVDFWLKAISENLDDKKAVPEP